MLKYILVLILVQFIFSSSLFANDKLNIFALYKVRLIATLKEPMQEPEAKRKCFG